MIEFLDRLEREEERLLVWGVVDGAFSGPEVESLAEKYLDDRDLWHVFPDPDDLLSLLDERRLLFRFIEGTRPRYRTRMAEAVRLFSKLRQIFPGRPWQLAPTLVADFRLARVPRR